MLSQTSTIDPKFRKPITSWEIIKQTIDQAVQQKNNVAFSKALDDLKAAFNQNSNFLNDNIERICCHSLLGHTKEVNNLLERSLIFISEHAFYYYALQNAIENKSDNLLNLYFQIKKLQDYGDELDNRSPGKGYKVRKLADTIYKEGVLFLNQTHSSAEASANLNRIMREGKKKMGQDRKIQDILAHIALGFTVIGAVVMLMKRALPGGSFFFNTTKRQKILNEIDRGIRQIMIKNL